MNYRNILVSGLFILSKTILIAQWVQDNPYQKGNWFAYWGYNKSSYTNSDIHFTGDNYDFTLQNVFAHDRQTPFDPKIYFSPVKFTIPQYNFRIGYFLDDHYQLSFGVDHMKYVMHNFQTAGIHGSINVGNQYDGQYSNDSIYLSKEFLQFEHTDGLNYGNFEFRRFDVLFSRKNFALAVNEGIGLGFLLPRTNTTLMNFERYDQFHLSGYGFAAVGAINLTFFKYFFIQSELKGGFIHMPDIRTTQIKVDRASQHFWFAQGNVVVGGNWYLPVKKKSRN